MFEELHCNGSGGHSGNRATFKRISEYFHLTTIRQDVGRWVRECNVCQQLKGENVKIPGILKSLEIPQEPRTTWKDIAMDFVTGLPKSKGSEVIWVIIDRFSRYDHFLALYHLITAKGLAHTFFENIYKLYGLPESILSDRDNSKFWHTLFKISETRLNTSSSYHPQSDGSTERVNQYLEHCLRSMTCQNPKNWASWLTAAEWWYNTTFQTSINSTPYEMVYGVKPGQLSWSSRVHTNLHSVESMLVERQQ